MPGKKTRTVNQYKTELGVTYEIMTDGSRRKLSREEAASVKPRRPSPNNTQVTKTQEQIKQEMFDANLEAVGLDPNQMRADEQKQEARRNGNLGSIYQTGDRIINSANRLGEQAGDKIQETGEKLRNIGSRVRDKIEKKIKK